MKRLPRFCVYKKAGAMQFSLTPAQDGADNEYELVKGCVMLEMTNATGQRAPNGLATYDWSQGKKLVMKLNDVDLQQILTGFRTGKVDILHDPGKANGGNGGLKKALRINKAPQSGYFVEMRYGEQVAKCSLSDDEVATLRILLSRSIARIYGW